MNIKQTIKKVLSESLRDRIIDLINDTGVINAIKFVGGYDELKKHCEVPVEEKIKTIKKYTNVGDMYGGFYLTELNEDPISYDEDSEGYHQIEYIGMNKVKVVVYGGYKNNTEMFDYNVAYEDLPEKTIEDIFEMVINQII